MPPRTVIATLLCTELHAIQPTADRPWEQVAYLGATGPAGDPHLAKARGYLGRYRELAGRT